MAGVLYRLNETTGKVGLKWLSALIVESMLVENTAWTARRNSGGYGQYEKLFSGDNQLSKNLLQCMVVNAPDADIIDASERYNFIILNHNRKVLLFHVQVRNACL